MRFNFAHGRKTRMIMCRFTEEVHEEVSRIATLKGMTIQETVFILIEGALNEIKEEPELLQL